ncbi:MAG: outer membrane protein assembly factor [Bacteroidia bacterium]|nr:outer membrane protein assembly factor [Methylotenera sp.]
MRKNTLQHYISNILMTRLSIRLCVCVGLLVLSDISIAQLGFEQPQQVIETKYEVTISAPTPLDALLKNHLEIIKARDSSRMSSAEWLTLYHDAPLAIQNLLATEGYFSSIIKKSIINSAGVSTVSFMVDPGPAALISKVNLKFSGVITQQTANESPQITTLRDGWMLPVGTKFRQADWNQAKRKLLISLLIDRYPNATIKDSRAEVDPKTNSVVLNVEVDSGAAYKFGNLTIEGLQRYPASIINSLNPIKPGMAYNQRKLQTFQSRLEESGYFRGVEVIADTKLPATDETQVKIANLKIMVVENQSIKVGVGAGFSTNTGARTQLTFDDINLFNLGWRLTSSLKVEQKAQSFSGLIRLPTDSDGYRDSLNASIDRTSIEGQTITAGKTGINRSWGPRKREQTVGVNYIIEHQNLDGATSDDKQAVTFSYGITLRRIDNERNPTLGYLLNTQFAIAPLNILSTGQFIQSYVKLQGYYPVTSTTQLIARTEVGMVNGKNSAPAAFLFRTGGDQSVRGYAYQSLGVKEGDAIVGGQYMVTGSVEMIQWLTNQWGVAAFVDFGNATNKIQDLKPVYGYGLGARWKSPVGPLGADIAYGEDTGEYRLHFNLGVAF